MSQTWTSPTSSNVCLKQHLEPQSTTRSIAHATSQLFSSKKWPVCLKTTTFSFETIAHEHKIICVQNINQKLRMRKRYSALSGETYCSFSIHWFIPIYDLFHTSFHHSNWLTGAFLSQQILTVLSVYCHHSCASPTWPVGFLYDPMFFEFVQLIFNLLF